MEIANFTLNNILYKYIFNNGQLEYKKIYNNKEYLLTAEEKAIMNILSRYIMISKDAINHVYITDIDIEGEKYQLYFDKVSFLKFFKQNGKFVNNENISSLLARYNDNSTSYFSRIEDSNLKQTRIMRLLAAGIVSINMFMIMLNVNSIQNTYAVMNYYTQARENFSATTLEDYSTIIDSNDNLSDLDKDLILKVADTLIEDQGKYINKDWIKYSNGHLKITTGAKKFDGTWNFQSSTIKMNDNLEKPDACYENVIHNSYEYILLHEITHSLCMPIVSSLGYRYQEGMTELLTQEYYPPSTGVAYNDAVIATKILIEILGEEKMISSYFNGDIFSVTKALAEIYGTEVDAIRLISLIDLQVENCINGKSDKNRMEVNPKIKEMLEKYYESKYDKPMSEDMLIQVYLAEGNYESTVTPKIEIAHDTRLEMKVVKKYYSEKSQLTKDYPIQFSFIKDGEYGAHSHDYNDVLECIPSSTVGVSNEEIGDNLLSLMHKYYFDYNQATLDGLLGSSLMKVIGPDEFKKVHDTGDISSLKETLAGIYGTKEEAEELIRDFDSYKVEYMPINEQIEKSEKVIGKLQNYFEAKGINAELINMKQDDIVTNMQLEHESKNITK